MIELIKSFRKIQTYKIYFNAQIHILYLLCTSKLSWNHFIWKKPPCSNVSNILKKLWFIEVLCAILTYSKFQTKLSLSKAYTVANTVITDPQLCRIKHKIVNKAAGKNYLSHMISIKNVFRAITSFK